MLFLWMSFNKLVCLFNKIPDGPSMLNFTRRISFVLYFSCCTSFNESITLFACIANDHVKDVCLTWFAIFDCQGLSLYFWRLFSFFWSLWLYLAVFLSVLRVLGSTWLMFNSEGSRSLALFTSSHLGCFLFDENANGISSTCGLLPAHDYLTLRIAVFQTRILDRLFLYISISISYWLPASGSKGITTTQLWSLFHPVQLKIGEYRISCIVSGIMGLF